MPATGDIPGYFEVFAGIKKPGEMLPVPATFHDSRATSNLFDNPVVVGNCRLKCPGRGVLYKLLGGYVPLGL